MFTLNSIITRRDITNKTTLYNFVVHCNICQILQIPLKCLKMFNMSALICIILKLAVHDAICPDKKKRSLCFRPD